MTIAFSDTTTEVSAMYRTINYFNPVTIDPKE